jgi:hypothetical protein
MIWFSSYWKEELLKLADKLKRRRRQKHFSERSIANLEKELFFAFYAIRKLLESKTLTQRVVLRSVLVDSYPSKGKGVTFLNFRFEIDKHFDFTKKTNEKVSLSFLCNQVIHSYIYFNEFYGNRLMRILIASDHMRNRKLYSIKISAIEKILRKVASDTVRGMTSVYDKKTGDYVVKNS